MEKIQDFDLEKISGGIDNGTTQKTYKCKDCKITFETEQEYKSHMKKVHDCIVNSKRGEA